MPFGKRFALIILVLVAVAAAVVFWLLRKPADDWRLLALPDISSQPLSLRIVYARNPRFADLPEAQLQNILQQTSVLMKQHFALDVVFENSNPVYVEELFAQLPEKVKQRRQSAIIDPRNADQADLARMRNELYEQLVSSGNRQQNLIDYARPYLLNGQAVNDIASLSRALIDTHLARLRYWYEDKASDGKPVIDGSPYNQWVWWDSLGYGNLPYDVVITNQLVASMESYDAAMHASLRGGINGGTMSYSRQGRYGGYVFVSVFALLNDTDMLAGLRDAMHYTDEQIVQYAAATLAHELGHLFFHYDH
ncbi:MAG: hypothetical protein QG652_285, partial [Pseudomonadota bacterium]|nr:hypothetical protein [Pseudomonadota bacterium]